MIDEPSAFATCTAGYVKCPAQFVQSTTAYILRSMNTVISVKVDQEVKDAASEVAKSVGLTLSALVNSYLRHVVATRRIELFAPEPMTPKLERLIGEIERELKSGKVSKKFHDAESFLADLKK